MRSPRAGSTILMLVLVVLMGGIASLANAASGNANKDEDALRAVLQSQVDAWNSRNLEGFMSGYWNSPELTFYSGGKIVKGWQPTLERYRKTYQSAGKEMGKLEFGELVVTVLGKKEAFVRGSWKLTMSDGKQPKGLFTLVFRKFPEGWRIIHDHTSAE